MIKKFVPVFLSILTLWGCASTAPLQGITPEGEKVYLGPVPLEKTPAFQAFLASPRTEVDEQRYLFTRLKDARDLEFFHDGSWYNSLQAYRGGMWLMRNRYKKGQNSREFILKHVKYSDGGKLHLAKYPDGSIQVGSAVLLNELDLLEESAKRS